MGKRRVFLFRDVVCCGFKYGLVNMAITYKYIQLQRERKLKIDESGGG